MVRKAYDTERGYMTLRLADEYIMEKLSDSERKEPSHYEILLKGAKAGRFGGKPYKKRMYQVERAQIMKYVENCMKEKQLHLQSLETGTDSGPYVSFYDKNTSSLLLNSLFTLYTYSIISKEIYEKESEKIKSKTK